MYNYDYERAVLSTVIFDPKTMEVLERIGVQESDFYHPFHQKLYRTISQLSESGVIDENTVRDAMGEDFSEVAMIDVLAATPISHLEYYAEKIRDYAKLRETKNIALSLLRSLENSDDLDSAIRTLYQGVERIEEDTKELFHIVPLSKIEAEDAKFICKSWLPFPMHAVSLVTAGGGVGKSFLLLQAAMRMVRDEGLRVFMWLSEDPLALSRYRAEMIATEILSMDLSLLEHLHLAGADSETIHFLQEGRAGVEVNSKFYRFKRMLQSYDVIILDPLIAMFGADENNNAHARMFIHLFTRWAVQEKKTIIFIHHATKNTSQSRGASAFVDAVRLVYRLEPIKNEKGDIVEDTYRYVILDKDNNGAKKYLGGHKVKREVFPKPKKSITIEYV